MPPLTRPTISKMAERGVKDGSGSRWEVSIDGTVQKTRKLMCFWSELPAVAEYFLGRSQIDGTGDPAVLQRLTPMPDPDDPTFHATRVQVVNNHKFLAPRGANPAIPGDRTVNPMADGTVAAKYLKTEGD